MKKVVAIQDLQFGSTGKGQIAGTLARAMCPDTTVTAWGPNAGHTFRDGEFKFVATMLAVSALMPSVRNILIGPGSVIDLDKLGQEIDAAGPLMRGKTLIIHPQATVLSEHHRKTEEDTLRRIGSTMKGTGAALCDKIMRNISAVACASLGTRITQALGSHLVQHGMGLAMSSFLYDRAIDDSEMLFIEGAQGFSLGYHTDFYPHATSRDVSTAQLLADCRVPIPHVWRGEHFMNVGVCRSYPIRVANRFNNDGSMVGTSGPGYTDQEELDWTEHLKREPELTTVTKLPRRIFSFSDEQITQAIRVMRPTCLALTFCDYLIPRDASEGDGPVGVVPEPVRTMVRRIEQRHLAVSSMRGRPPVRLLSFGPTTKDVYTFMDDDWTTAPVTDRTVQPIIEDPVC